MTMATRAPAAGRASAASASGALEVAGWMDRLSGHIERHPGFWKALGGIETRLLGDRLDSVPLDRPIYVTGLARSGTTILLELLSRHPDTATHRYRDYPPVLVPWAWSWFLDRAAPPGDTAVERAHGDRIMVTAESPEAFEEAVWMAFFEDAHDPTRNAVLDETTERGDFASFYRNHLRKLLLARGGSRYLAKGNYNVTRLAYLKRILPDALFVVPVRDPVAHIASLVRQHEHFCREGARNGRVRRHMRRSGHFEFGLDRRAIHTGDPESAERIRAHWEAGREVEGWAEYWASLYGHVHATLERRSDVREATLLVRYEDLCATPNAVVGEVLAHCGLTPHALPEAAAREVRAPDYYRMGFTDEETDTIVRRTASVARLFGYGEVAG